MGSSLRFSSRPGASTTTGIGSNQYSQQPSTVKNNHTVDKKNCNCTQTFDILTISIPVFNTCRANSDICFLFLVDRSQEVGAALGEMALLKIECFANPIKAETKLAANEKVKSSKIFCRKHATTSNGICLSDVEDYSKEGWKKNEVNMIGEDDGLIRLTKLRPVMPTPMPDDDEKEEEEGGSISVAMLHPMRIDSGFLCKKHRTQESFLRESIYIEGI